jgi:DnaJ like chaperone protein
MSWTGKIVGAILGFLIFRGPLGALIGAILGHLYDQSVAMRRPVANGGAGGGNPLEIGARFFTATFEVMGYVAKSDGRVSEEEIAAARKVMAELRLNGAQVHTAIAHYTRGKSAEFDLEETMRGFAAVCANRPDLLRVFLEVQVRAALEGVDMKGPAKLAVQKVAELLDVSRLELAHMEQVLRLRREQFKASGAGSAGGQPPPRSSMQLAAAYQILEVEVKATNDEVAKAYRRQLSKHHPDKLKANGLPDSMLEHAKQRTQQIIEAYELIKSARQR